MGYYASGDIKKTVHSSENDEGYENQSFYSTTSFGILTQSEIGNNSYFPYREKSANTFSELLPASDDSDKPFWAENELSSSESKQQLIKRQKRRRSLSYRNRIAKHRRKFLLFQSSSSSIDSISDQMSTKVSRQKKYNHCKDRFDVVKLQPGCNITKKMFTRNINVCVSYSKN